MRNDDNTAWLRPAFNQMHRVLKDRGFALSFYAWNRVDLFMAAWKAAGFRPMGHIIFRKSYASSARFVRYTHEAAYLLAKGDAKLPRQSIPDVIDMPYSGSRMHPTQKPVAALLPLVHAFCPAGGLVLDPFCGSGSSLVAAQHLGRDWLAWNWTQPTPPRHLGGWPIGARDGRRHKSPPPSFRPVTYYEVVAR
ncbi:MAG: DNA methylase [Acetobacter sp.]|nr:DNA methyltransferase [Acetobacter sp.]MCH4092356.1 DNA methylase [Acetobacter sp.]MCI1300968.1 DNA methylase [Acetobacter sp.]MCI1317260.1 DNA methylase [Acetobacter sp.]